jgi:hypothetical protein
MDAEAAHYRQTRGGPAPQPGSPHRSKASRAVTPAPSASDQTPRATRPRDGPEWDPRAEWDWIELTEWRRGQCDRGHILWPGRYVSVLVNGVAFRACVQCHSDRTKPRAIERGWPPRVSPNPQL